MNTNATPPERLQPGRSLGHMQALLVGEASLVAQASLGCLVHDGSVCMWLPAGP